MGDEEKTEPAPTEPPVAEPPNPEEKPSEPVLVEEHNHDPLSDFRKAFDDFSSGVLDRLEKLEGKKDDGKKEEKPNGDGEPKPDDKPAGGGEPKPARKRKFGLRGKRRSD